MRLANCSSRTFYVDLYRGAQKICRQELPMRIPEELSYKHQDLNDNARQGPLEEDFNRISTRSSQKKLWKTLGKIFMSGPLREFHKIVTKGPAAAAGADLTRSWYKNLPRASHKSFQTSTSKTCLKGPGFVPGICVCLSRRFFPALAASTSMF